MSIDNLTRKEKFIIWDEIWRQYHTASEDIQLCLRDEQYEIIPKIHKRQKELESEALDFYEMKCGVEGRLFIRQIYRGVLNAEPLLSIEDKKYVLRVNNK